MGDPTGEQPRDVWIVFTGRGFLRTWRATGMLDGLRDALGSRFVPILLFSDENASEWKPVAGERAVLRSELMLPPTTLRQRAAAKIDRLLDRQLGYFPLALRLSLRNGFHSERIAPGYGIGYLNLNLVGRLPRWRWIESAMKRWHFGKRRYVPTPLLGRMERECAVLVIANLQSPRVMPFLAAARRLGRPVVGYLASWDNAVGKGVVTPYLDRYVVQNNAMREDLERYHGIPPSRVTVTGWPQSDVYADRRPRSAFADLVRGNGLDPALPVVLFVGNWPLHAPYDGPLGVRLAEWWGESGMSERASLLIRPHPGDTERHERFAGARGRERVHVQDATWGDFELLVTLLQHVACVIVNGGTILLDAIVNDRPAVCIAYDEGAPPGERFAYKNLLGEHYRVLMGSTAFYRAERFDDVVAGIEAALARPAELAEERKRVAREVVGELDGRAAERAVQAILQGAGLDAYAPSIHSKRVPASASRTSS